MAQNARSKHARVPRYAIGSRHASAPKHTRAAKHAVCTPGPPWAARGGWGLIAIVLVWGIAATAETHIKTGQIKAADVISSVEPSVDSSASSPEVAADSVAVGPISVVPGLALAALRQPASVGVAPASSGARPSDVPMLLGATEIPRLAQLAYLRAATIEAHTAPGCGLSWQILAGIGLVESNHARSGGSGRLSWSGVANPAILGPVLDGQHGYPAIKDTDHGVLDADVTFDRAVGPMQFLPATWREYAGTAGGASNPENISDAAGAAGRYLCATGVNLRTPAGLIDAVYGYNHSFTYVTNVVSAAQQYADGALPAAAVALTELPALTAGQPTASFVSDAVSTSPSETSSHAPSSAPSAGSRLPTAPLSVTTVVPPAMPHPVSTPTQVDVTSSPPSNASPDPTVSGSASDSASPTDTFTGPASPTDTSTGSASPTDMASPTGTASPTNSVSTTASPAPSSSN